MPVTLRCSATGDLLLVDSLAKKLLALLGKDASVAGILEPQDMSGALMALKSLQDTPPAASSQAEPDKDDASAFSGEAVSLRTRAWPLIKMIEEAKEANKPIVWGA